MTGKPLRRADIEAFADRISADLAAIEAGELTASPSLRHKLEGALMGVRIALGEDPADVLAELAGEDHPPDA